MDSSPGMVNIELAVQVGSDPIAGELRAREAPARPFVGWVALVRSLEDAMSAATEQGEAR